MLLLTTRVVRFVWGELFGFLPIGNGMIPPDMDDFGVSSDGVLGKIIESGRSFNANITQTNMSLIA